MEIKIRLPKFPKWAWICGLVLLSLLVGSFTTYAVIGRQSPVSAQVQTKLCAEAPTGFYVQKSPSDISGMTVEVSFIPTVGQAFAVDFTEGHSKMKYSKDGARVSETWTYSAPGQYSIGLYTSNYDRNCVNGYATTVDIPLKP